FSRACAHHDCRRHPYPGQGRRHCLFLCRALLWQR
ncbi:hypothetical protein BN1708_019852, partial [Verticillium longisporum]